MADQPTVEDTKPVEAPVVAPEPNVLETTTVKDGNLPINVSAPTALPSAADPGSPTVAAPETPILVTESEGSPTQADGTGLADEVASFNASPLLKSRLPHPLLLKWGKNRLNPPLLRFQLQHQPRHQTNQSLR